MRNILVAVTTFLLTALLCGAALADGLKTGFGKVELGNVPMGVDYSMKKDANFPLVIESKNDYPVDLKIEVVKPQVSELNEGYEAIPDTSWIRLEKDSFVLDPLGKAETDVIVHIPPDENLKGKKYQVFLWSYTVGGSLGMGLNSKLMISIANEEPVVTEK